MMSWSPDVRGESELGLLEVAWESSVRSGRDPNVVVDAAGTWGFGLRYFSGGRCGADIWELMWGAALESYYRVVNLGRTSRAAMRGNVELRPSMTLCFHKR